MPKLKINGKEYEAPVGQNVLQFCMDHDVEVPYYCYHPGLSVAANCRMCLVKTSTSRKLEPSCALKVQGDMDVDTQCKEVQDARKSVLEFMLINHPVDCTICDKAGECDLQDYTYQYRKGLSRFKEDKVIKETKILGPTVKIWQNRCIACSRCERFCNEISGTGELSLINRSDHSTIDIFPGVPLDNPLSLNTVDLCPVGALHSRDFLYQARVWFVDTKDSVCASCSTGCNIKTSALDQEIKRLEPRFNEEVNGHWICDRGRLNYKYVNDENRLRSSTGTLAELARSLKAVSGLGLIASTYATCEELFLLKKLKEALEVKDIGFLTEVQGKDQHFKKFVIHADQTPNTKGAETIFGEEIVKNGLKQVIDAIHKKTIKGVLLLQGIPNFTPPEKLEKALDLLDFLAVCDIQNSPLSEKASLRLAGATVFEKEGTFVNYQGRIQKNRRALELPSGCHNELDLLQELLQILGFRPQILSTEGVFKQIAKEIPTFKDLSYAKVGESGVAVP
ncbi:MAG: 2Fe-2S iron-sulfur cluster-binding protein [Planctomycetota bacterium]